MERLRIGVLLLSVLVLLAPSPLRASPIIQYDVYLAEDGTGYYTINGGSSLPMIGVMSGAVEVNDYLYTALTFQLPFTFPSVVDGTLEMLDSNSALSDLIHFEDQGNYISFFSFDHLGTLADKWSLNYLGEPAPAPETNDATVLENEGGFTNYTPGNRYPGYAGSLYIMNYHIVSDQAPSVPEPGTMVFALAGLGLIGLSRRLAARGVA